MSDQVFGTPVTDSTVQGVNIGITNITARDRAELALRYMYADNRAGEAREFLDGLRRRFGSGVSTLCSIFNATGGTLTFVRSHTWKGSIYVSPYPHVIQNGQWGTFLHVMDGPLILGTPKEAVVYRGRNNAGTIYEWVVAWNTAMPELFQNRVYTDVRANTFMMNWNTFNTNLESTIGNHTVTTMGCYSSVSVGAGSSPYFTAIMSLEGVARDAIALASDINTIFPSRDSEDGVDDEATPAAAE